MYSSRVQAPHARGNHPSCPIPPDCTTGLEGCCQLFALLFALRRPGFQEQWSVVSCQFAERSGVRGQGTKHTVPRTEYEVPGTGYCVLGTRYPDLSAN